VPVKITREFLLRGQDRFTIFCSPCHARTGLGNGMIVERGLRKPPSYHSDRLRNAPAGHSFVCRAGSGCRLSGGCGG